MLDDGMLLGSRESEFTGDEESVMKKVQLGKPCTDALSRHSTLCKPVEAS